MPDAQLALSWDNFQQTMQAGMFHMLEAEDLVDVTLACEGKYLRAHKMVLSVCSPYFKDLFRSNPCKHPIIFMKDVKFKTMNDLLTYMYKGEVMLTQELLPSFVKLGESLLIKGLTNEEPSLNTSPKFVSCGKPLLSTTTTNNNPISAPRVIKRAATAPLVPRPHSGGHIRRIASVQPTETPVVIKRQRRMESIPMRTEEPSPQKVRFKTEDPLRDDGATSEHADEDPEEQLTTYTTEAIQIATPTPIPTIAATTTSASNIKLDQMEIEMATIHHQSDDVHHTEDAEVEEEEETIVGAGGGDTEGEEEVTEEQAVLEHELDEGVEGEEELEDREDEDEHLEEIEVPSDDTHDIKDMASSRTQRKQDMPRYIVDGFVFHVNIMKGTPSMTYLRCLEYKRLGCHARAVMPSDGSIQDIQLTQTHNHPPDYAAEEKIVFLRELKDFLLRNINLTTKEVYDLLQPIYPTAASETPFEAIKSKMGRWKRMFLMDNEMNDRFAYHPMKEEMIIP